MKQKMTIKDVARLAGVSKATVSRVLNHKPSVDPELRQRVMKVVRERGFSPSMVVSPIRSRRAPLIGVLAPPVSWPLMPEIMLGISSVTDETSYEVQYTMSANCNHRQMLEQLLSLKLSQGFLAIVPGRLGDFLDELYALEVPIVIIDDQDKHSSLPWIGIDNAEAAYQATSYLLSLGHRRIGHILGREGYLCTRERYEGYARALREAGIEPDPALLWHGDFTPDGGRECGLAIFSLSPEKRPTALFAANDQTALGVMEVAAEHHVRIPDDLSIVGFDDAPQAAWSSPALTTIKQPYREMGALASQLLLTLIDPSNGPFIYKGRDMLAQAGETHTPVQILLPTELIRRTSCRSLSSL